MTDIPSTRSGESISEFVHRMELWKESQRRHFPEADKPGKYDLVLKPFVKHMERELHANAHKGDRSAWLNLTRDSAMFEIYDHSAKLAHAVRVDDHARIKEHAADIANACMMLLDAWSLLVDPITGEAA